MSRKPKPKPWGGARAGAGRMATGQTRKKLGVAITESQYQKLMSYCERYRIGTSTAIQRILDGLP